MRNLLLIMFTYYSAINYDGLEFGPQSLTHIPKEFAKSKHVLELVYYKYNTAQPGSDSVLHSTWPVLMYLTSRAGEAEVIKMDRALQSD